MAGMFGVIVSGRLVQTDFQQTGETRFVVSIPDADSINHVVVFLTGATPFPEGVGGAVYFSGPSADGAPAWHYLGVVSNAKPSAIFKVISLKKTSAPDQAHNAFLSSPEMQRASNTAQIGISAEPLSTLAGLTETQNTAVTAQAWQLQFGQAMCESLHNYAGSFARPLQELPSLGLAPSETFLPFSSLITWYNNFQRKLSQNTNFWRK